MIVIQNTIIITNTAIIVAVVAATSATVTQNVTLYFTELYNDKVSDIIVSVKMNFLCFFFKGGVDSYR